jgi:hypothetical protein
MYDPSIAVNEAAKLIKLVPPTNGKWFADTHSTLREQVLIALERCKKFEIKGDIAVMIGMRGTVIERIEWVLADYLIGAGWKPQPRYRTVLHLSLDSVRWLADVYGTVRIARDVLQATLERATAESAILVLDHLEVLDEDQPVANSMKAALTNPSGALVLALYWENEHGGARRSGILSLANARWQIPAEPYPPERTHGTIFDHIARYWQDNYRYAFEGDAFDSVINLEPLVWVGANPPRRMTLPYLPIFMGTDAIETAMQGGAAVESLARRALAALARLRQEKGPSREVIDHFAPVLSEAEGDLNKLLSRPTASETRGRTTTTTLTRAHVVCQLFGPDDHHFRYPTVRPSQPLFQSSKGTSAAASQGGTASSQRSSGEPIYIDPKREKRTER